MSENVSLTLPAEVLVAARAQAEADGISVEQVLRVWLGQMAALATAQPANVKVSRGEIYWLRSHSPAGQSQGAAHPHVVVQDDLFNHSRVDTVIVCAITTNPKRAGYPGNIQLEAGEGNLPKPSIVEVSKVTSVHKVALGEPIGALSDERIEQILAGLRFLQRSFMRD